MGEKEFKMKAVTLLSGGLDSCVTASIAKKEYSEVLALTFSYGQTHVREIESAKKIAEHLNLTEHRIIQIDPKLFSSSALIGDPRAIPQRGLNEIKNEIPSTYVPGRNIVFLSHALAYAENMNAEAIFIGVNAVDYSGYPDCRPEFIEAFQRAVDLGTKKGVEGKTIKIKTPLMYLTKKQV